MKVIAVFGDSPCQKALAHRIHRKLALAHIARIRPTVGRKRNIIRSAVSLTLGRPLRVAWYAMLDHFGAQYPDWPTVSATVHDTANALDLIDLIEREHPDLVLVSGTDLLRKATLQRFETNVMNLHTGISPYIRGGPNCTNWALAIGDFDLIGNTVMWIDSGIDSGAIITTERTPLNGHETLSELHIKVMDHAHDLYCRAVDAFGRGQELASVPQKAIAKGRLFYTRDWDSFAMLRAVFNYRFRYRPFLPRGEIRLIELGKR